MHLGWKLGETQKAAEDALNRCTSAVAPIANYRVFRATAAEDEARRLREARDSERPGQLEECLRGLRYGCDIQHVAN